MKKKIFITLLSTILMVTLMPLAVFADGGSDTLPERNDSVTGATVVSEASAFSHGQHQRLSIARALETGEVLAKVQAYKADELQQAAVPLELLGDMDALKDAQAASLRNIIGDLELNKALASRDAASIALFRDMVKDGFIPVTMGGCYAQIVFAEGAECEPYLTTEANRSGAVLRATELQTLEKTFEIRQGEIHALIGENVTLQQAEADAIAALYFMPNQFALQSEDVQLACLKAARERRLELHIAKAELAVAEQSASKIASNADEAIQTMTDQGQLQTDVDEVQAYASSFGAGSIMLICACAGVFVLAGIIVVIVAKRREKSGQIEVEVKK